MNSSRIELLWLVWDQSRSKYYLRTKFQDGIHLEKDSLALIEWFSCNQMKANPDKFQALAIGKKSMDMLFVVK
jgi:hypothetical protein